MFRDMRRKNQQLAWAECEEVLHRNTSGVLAVLGDEGYPYAVPLSYAYDSGALYFHCAKSGHKLDAIRRCDKVSFCVTDQDTVVPQEYTTYFRSVIVFGRARILESEQEKRAALQKIAVKYSPAEPKESRDQEIAKSMAAVCIVKIDIEHITGKEAKELVKNKNA